MIAATAHAHGARLVTANVVDAGHLSELIEIVPLPRAQTPLNGEVCPILTLFSAPSKGGVYWPFIGAAEMPHAPAAPPCTPGGCVRPLPSERRAMWRTHEYEAQQGLQRRRSCDAE